MIDHETLLRIGYGALFLALSVLVIFFRLMPFGSAPGGFIPPDLILLAGFAWVLRRPDFVPVLLFAAIMFTADLLFLRPPGLDAGLAVIALATLRARGALMRGQSFGVEWATVGVVLVLMMLARQGAQFLFVLDGPGFATAVMALLSNLIAYPLVVAVSVWALHVRRPAPGERAVQGRLA